MTKDGKEANANPRSAHFCGIGGTAMVAGARLAIEAGWEVRGSDNPLYPPTSEMTAALGVPVAVGYAAENLDWNPDVVMVGNALSRGNPEVEAVLERRMRYLSLPEWLKEEVLRPRRPVAVCGTHGKTTTSALTAWLLAQAGLEPGYLIGGQPVGFPHSAKLGEQGKPFVIEGDEYDTAFFDKRAKFFHYLPEIAIVTSIEFDHGDIYPDLAAIERAFQLMLRQVPRSGWLLACADNPSALALREHAPCGVMTYGLAEHAGFRAVALGTQAGFVAFEVFFEGSRWGTFKSPLAGRHNVQNALAGLAAAHLLGAPADALAPALASFPGVRRRMEVFLESRGAVFVDDFAHHPTAIAETVRGARERWPDRRLRVLCEPRSNTMVTNRFQRELARALERADEVHLGPIHRAETIPADLRLDREAVAAALRANGAAAAVHDDVRTIVDAVCGSLAEGDVVLVCSNGAFGGIYQLLRDALGST